MYKFLIVYFFISILFSNITLANEKNYPIGSIFEIKNAESVNFSVDNPSICKIENNKITFIAPGEITIRALASYSNGSLMEFNEHFVIVENNNVSSSRFTPVPLNQLQNYTLLHQYLTNEQLKESYDVALKIAQKVTATSLDNKLKQLSLLLRQYYEDNVTYSTESPHFLDAYGFFITKQASCQGAACATGLVLNILGIDYEHINHNLWEHQWCRVNVNGTYWIVDPYGAYCGPDPEPYEFPHPNMIILNDQLTYAY